MSKTLQLSLNKKLIIEAVKADTYITGTIEKSVDPTTRSAKAYNMQAGDDTYQERKLSRTLSGAVGSLEANLAEFIDTSATNAISDTLPQAGDDGGFIIEIKVSDRYNSGLAYPITQLSQEYIINKMLYYWWQSIDAALAKDYLGFCNESLMNIRLCLAKTAPSTNSLSYEDVTGTVDSDVEGDTTTVADLSYSISDHGFATTPTNVTSIYALHGNCTIACTDPTARFNVKVGNDIIFSTTASPYSLSQSNYVALQRALASAGVSADILFIPQETISTSSKLIITYKS